MRQYVSSLIKAVCVILLVTYSFSCAVETKKFTEFRKPNIVLIFIDDMGWKDAGFMGSDLYQTPNIDRLAKEGMVFTQAYAGAGNCAPSRACLISGQYTPRHGVYAVNSTNRGPKNLMRLMPVPNTNDLVPENVTVAEALKAAGYATGMFGKWHLGHGESTYPAAQGFDVAENWSSSNNNNFKNDNDPKHIYKITSGACQFIEDNKDRPFFAYISHHATHMGIQTREEMYKKFELLPEGKLHKHKKFAAMNCQMDDGVGIVLSKLKELGLDENTLVVFTSDNGALPQSPPDPLRGRKGMYYEGGIRVPMIVRWPGKTKPGTICDVPVHNVDFYTTFLAVAGGDIPSGKALDGADISPLFQSKPFPDRGVFWHFPGYLNSNTGGSRSPKFRTRPVSVIRKGDWKLHLYHEEWVLDGGRDKIDVNNSVELYNIKEDVSESKNLTNTNPAKRDELLGELLSWFKKTDALLPSEKNPQYDPAKRKK